MCLSVVPEVPYASAILVAVFVAAIIGVPGFIDQCKSRRYRDALRSWWIFSHRLGIAMHRHVRFIAASHIVNDRFRQLLSTGHKACGIIIFRAYSAFVPYH